MYRKIINDKIFRDHESRLKKKKKQKKNLLEELKLGAGVNITQVWKKVFESAFGNLMGGKSK